jgi:hypothetical protein
VDAARDASLGTIEIASDKCTRSNHGICMHLTLFCARGACQRNRATMHNYAMARQAHPENSLGTVVRHRIRRTHAVPAAESRNVSLAGLRTWVLGCATSRCAAERPLEH